MTSQILRVGKVMTPICEDVLRAKGYRGLVDSGGRSLKKVYLCDVICDVPQEYSSDPNKDPTP